MGRISRAEEPPMTAGRTYRVTGPHPVYDCKPGLTFTMELEPSHEKWLIDLGHVELVVAPGPDTDNNGAQGTEQE